MFNGGLAFRQEMKKKPLWSGCLFIMVIGKLLKWEWEYTGKRGELLDIYSTAYKIDQEDLIQEIN